LVMRFPPAPNLVIVPKENIIYCKATYYLDWVVSRGYHLGRGLPLFCLPLGSWITTLMGRGLPLRSWFTTWAAAPYEPPSVPE
jgi:hypothetical protein